MPLEPYESLAKKGPTMMVDATRFLEWYDAWNAERERLRGIPGSGDRVGFTDIVSVDELAEFSGFSARRITSARATGRIDYAKAEAFLINAGVQEPWRILDVDDELQGAA